MSYAKWFTMNVEHIKGSVLLCHMFPTSTLSGSLFTMA